MSKYIDVEHLKRAAQGRWPTILATLGGLSEAAANFPSAKHSQCPFPHRHHTSGGKRKFRLWQPNGETYQGQAICSCATWGDGIHLLRDLTGWTFVQCVEEINAYLGDPLDLGHHTPIEKHGRPSTLTEAQADAKQCELTARRDAYRKRLLNTVWEGGLAVTDPAAEPLRRYLATRGIPPAVLESVQGDELRFHPRLEFRTNEGRCWGHFPALIATVRDAEGNPVTLHRTYLSSDGGKASVPDGEAVKKIMSYPSTRQISGGAIQLFPTRPLMGITEGIETALAVYAATGVPVWASYSANMLEKLDLSRLDGVRQLLIWADKDASETGERVARELKAKAWRYNMKCRVLLPEAAITGKGIDWNDVLACEGEAGFPEELLRR
jgi:phage/plasmid primase-like uncharacterized protein